MAGSFEKTLYGARTLASNEVIELSDNFPADRFGSDDHPRDGGGDEQYGRDRKERVVGDDAPRRSASSSHHAFTADSSIRTIVGARLPCLRRSFDRPSQPVMHCTHVKQAWQSGTLADVRVFVGCTHRVGRHVHETLAGFLHGVPANPCSEGTAVTERRNTRAGGHAAFSERAARAKRDGMLYNSSNVSRLHHRSSEREADRRPWPSSPAQELRTAYPFLTQRSETSVGHPHNAFPGTIGPPPHARRRPSAPGVHGCRWSTLRRHLSPVTELPSNKMTPLPPTIQP